VRGLRKIANNGGRGERKRFITGGGEDGGEKGAIFPKTKRAGSKLQNGGFWGGQIVLMPGDFYQRKKGPLHHVESEGERGRKKRGARRTWETDHVADRPDEKRQRHAEGLNRAKQRSTRRVLLEAEKRIFFIRGLYGKMLVLAGKEKLAGDHTTDDEKRDRSASAEKNYAGNVR